ncbi:MAG: DUF4124 domain-containing protein [Gammaproteobacteria bacterium]
MGRPLAGLPTLLLIWAACTTGTAEAGGIYKWQDENGKTHFSDQPPPDVAAEKVRTPAATAGAEGDTGELEALRERVEEGYEARMEKRKADEKARAEAEKIAAHCKETRAKLEHLQNSTRHQVINEAGEREFMREETRQEWMRCAREEIAKHCQ